MKLDTRQKKLYVEKNCFRFGLILVCLQAESQISDCIDPNDLERYKISNII